MAEKITNVQIGAYHDFIAMNHKEIVYDPTPEESDRILRESKLTPEEAKAMSENLNRQCEELKENE